MPLLEKIKVGDKVWARNEKTGAVELRAVTSIVPQHRDKLVELRIEGEREPLKPSINHPFWVRRSTLAKPAWIEAASMLAGDQVLTASGQWRKVLSVTALAGSAVVYNFEVEGDHDYFVGRQGLLVHNAFCSLDNNALIAAIEKGEGKAVESALAGDVPVASSAAAAEFAVKGDVDALNQWLAERGGSIAPPVTSADAAALQAQAAAVGRSFGPTDAEIAAQAARDSMPILTRDVGFMKTLAAIGQAFRTF